MTGVDLLKSAMDGIDVSETLTKALMEHILSGEPLDCILRLKATSAGERAPRTQILQRLRGEALLESFLFIKSESKVSDYKACSMLFDIVLDKSDVPEEIADRIFIISVYSEALGIELSSAKALYNAINTLLNAQL